MKVVKNNWIVTTTLFLYAILLCMTIIFYQERLNIDSSYYFFKTLNRGFFYIEHQRYVLAIAELPVVLGGWLGLSLKHIVVLYSVWHVLFFFLIGALLLYHYKKTSYILLMLSLQTIGILYSFVNPIFELYYGVALAAWLYIILKENSRLHPRHYIMLAVLSFFIISSHPFNIILYAGIIATDFIRRKKNVLPLTAISLVLIFLLTKSLFISDYEQGKIWWTFNFAQNKTYENLFTLSYWQQHLLFLWRHYFDWLLLVPLFLVVGFRYLSSIVFLITVSLFVLVVGFAHLSFTMLAPSGYAEQVFFISIPVVLFCLFIEILPLVKNYWLVRSIPLVIFFLVGMRLYKQYNLGKDYSQRVVWIQQQTMRAMENNNCKALILVPENANISHYLGWDIPFTSMVYSSMQKGKRTFSIVPMHVGDSNFFYNIAESTYYFRLEEIMPMAELDNHYFDFCAQEKYRFVR